MLVSFNWLKQYVKLTDAVTPKEVGDKLTMSTVEVEGVESLANDLEGIVVGKIVAVEKHPDADKLKVCQVGVGNETLSVVCGGSNLEEKMLVALGKIGAKVRWHGEGEPIVLKQTKIRGVNSEGMICQSTEIGLGEMFPLKDERQIIDLAGLATDESLGKPLATVLGLDDAIFDIDNKSMTHRPDLWGHYGLAREVAALYKKDLKAYEVPELKAGKEVKVKVSIEDRTLCPRYMAVAVSGIKVGPSPDWLHKYLQAVGLRSINNIVDITNYVMFDLGQPLHAFDSKFLIGNKEKELNIIVRPAKDGEEFVTLDVVKHKLDPSVLVIANVKEPIALAGIMGGLNSGVSESTETVVFESANFDPIAVRKAALKLGIRTDSSARFEKSLDPNLAEIALKKAVTLTLGLCPGAKVVSNVVDEKSFSLNQGPIDLRWDFLFKKIGLVIDKKEVVSILSRLGFEVKEKKDAISVKVPTWRATKDISIPEDIVEEVARIYGFGNIPTVMPLFPIDPPVTNDLRNLEHRLRNVLVRELAYSEASNYSFVSAEQIKALGGDVAKYIELDNPLSKEKPYLRRTLINNLLENIKQNIENFSTVRLFEIGQTFLLNEAGPRVKASSDELLPRQDTWLTSVIAIRKGQNLFNAAKQVVEGVAQELKSEFTYRRPENPRPWQHQTRTASIFYNNELVGTVYEIHPAVLARFGLVGRVATVDLVLNRLVELGVVNNEVKYQAVPVYPEVVRDFAFVIPEEVTHEVIKQSITSAHPLVKQVELFDSYQGDKIAGDKKSLAYHITYGSNDRTLTAEEINTAHENVVKNLVSELGAEVRK